MTITTPRIADATWYWNNEPCRAACPVHTDAGGYIAAIAEGRDRDAYLIARARNPFPSICGRVCAAPCESACRRGRIDAPVSIRALKRFVTERHGVESFSAGAAWHEAHGAVPEETRQSVAVIGGGPAGLAAAHDLRLAGHPVTVYEAESRLGGMMVLGIPEYRLPRGLIEREVEAILEMGVQARTGVCVGRDCSISELLAEHAAVFVAAGTGVGRQLDLPGSELDGVLRAVEFLLNVNRGFRVNLGKRVVVVGGGNVAFDAARTALRAAVGSSNSPIAPQHASRTDGNDARRSMTTALDVARTVVREGVVDVTVVALEAPDEMPAAAEEIADAEAEGVRIVYRRGPHRFLGDTCVTGLETIGVESVFDEQGRFAPQFRPGTIEVMPADTVILAVGQSADLGFLDHVPEVAPDPRGFLRVDPDSLQTSHPRIWAGGDVAHGPRNLVDAIADGQRAAASISAALGGTEPPDFAMTLEARPGFRRLASAYDAVARVVIPTVAIERRVGFGEVESGYDQLDALLESSRCLRCFENVVLDRDLCILCGLCVDVCPTRCITIARADRHGLGTAAQSVLLLDEDLCIRCALCVNRCPPGALAVARAEEVVSGRA